MKRDNPPTFTDREYNSNDGMLTTVWGPGIWHFLHTISFNYPVHPTEDQKRQYRDFFLQLRHVLPCGKCRKNFASNIKTMPLTRADLENRNAFSRYMYKFHETVNRMLGKKSGLTYDDVRERYENFRARCNTPTASPAPTATKTAKIPHSSKGGEHEIKRSRDSHPQRKTAKNRKTAEKMNKHEGCTEPLFHGEKSKCVLKIVPQTEKCPTMEIDDKCIKRRV
jgi:hypothetical protein